MSDAAIRVEILSPDDGDGILNLLISATNGSFSAAQDIWSYADVFNDFAHGLCEFPQRPDNALLEIGSMEDRSPYYLRMRAYLFDRVGHAAIEISIDNRRSDENLAKSTFQIHCEVAAINRLGRNLLSWSSKPTGPMQWNAIEKGW